MIDQLQDWHGTLPTVFLLSTIAGVAFWEERASRRALSCSLRDRWPANLGLGAINAVMLYLILPFATVGFSLWVEHRGFGLLHVIATPYWFAVIAGFLLLDLTRYLHHYLLHRVPLLWNFHRVHHADHDYDFTVGLRFHPIEALFTTAFLFGAILLLGPPPEATLAAELAVAVSGMVVHANAKAPAWLERYGRLVLVTPDMHRIHHSTVMEEHNSNYASVLSVWDRMFASYVSEPAAGHEQMSIGLSSLRGSECLSLRWCLLAPFRRATGRAAASLSS